MAGIIIQMGHVPRTSGKTGTYREQEFVKIIGPKLLGELRVRGHSVGLIGADSYIPKCDLFLSLHTDGNNDKSIRGASVGYPSDNPNSKHGRIAGAWKRHHQLNGFLSGFHQDNYTDGLRFYYGFGKVNAEYEFLAEHGTTTNPEDEAWLFSHIDQCVKAHVDAIGEILGHPNDIPIPTPTPNLEDDMRLWLLRREDRSEIWITDLLTKRHVQSESELNDLVYLNQMQGGKMLWTPDPGSTVGSGSYAMVRVLGSTNTWLDSIPVA